MNETALLWLILITLLAIAFVLPQLMVRFSAPKVVRILREHGAVDVAHAAFAADMGLGEKTMWERAFRRRDFKPKALLAMIHLGVVQQDDQGRVYLCEEELAKTVWKDN